MKRATCEQCDRCYFYGKSTSDYTCDRYIILGMGHRLGKHEPNECPKFLKKRCTAEDIERNKELDK